QKNYPWAKSVVVCIRRMGKYRIPKHLQGLIGKSYLTDSRRDTQSKDYQDSIKFETYLKEQGLQTAVNRDRGITGLRWAAYKAGLGLIRKNNFFYTANGSWIHLEAWLINKELELIEHSTLKECPASCDLCMKACPTKSLSEPYLMNRNTCVACLTSFEGLDLINEKNNHLMGAWIYGCDVCQDACPFNQTTRSDEDEFPNLKELVDHISLEKIIEMDYDYLRNVIQPRFWYIPLEKVWKWKMNALNAMLNTYKSGYEKYIDLACNDENEHVRRMAQWVKMKTAHT
ncbi:MAG: hypothetical protein QG670_678, partial [Thermoproteota archaeon]|nr:hypothetical protein [Thermoproteota archaeon]